MRTQYWTVTGLGGYIATEDDALDRLFPLDDPGTSSCLAFVAEVGALATVSTTCEGILRHGEQGNP